MLSEASIRRAVAILGTAGDTDLFPALPELKFFSDREDAVVRRLLRMNHGQYHPVSAIEMLTPKSLMGFRIGHQLTATDTLLLTAATIEAGPQLEAMRERLSGENAFSYRFDRDGERRLFKPDHSYHDWIQSLSTLGGEEPFADDSPVLETDISDFYSRVYIHRLENVLQDAGVSREASTIIRNIISVCRARQSFGLPVGTAAARLLAESVLSDTDSLLNGLGLKFSRFVDDYRIVASPALNSHTILCRLAEHLMVAEGLSLNPSKTRITSTQLVQDSSRQRLQDVFSDAEFREIR